MSMRSVATFIFVFLLLSPASAQQEGEIEAAEKSARAWLALTDNGQYLASWEQASSFFRAAVTAEDWGSALERARSPFGALLSRATGTSTYATTLPGAPDGEYVVFEFNSAFENKAAAVETVTVMKDIDTAWRIAGYFVR